MSQDKSLFDYVMNTPHNTNPAILKQKVKENSGVSSWNDLKDKPFYEESNKTDIIPMQIIVFDGDYANLTKVSSEQVSVGTSINVSFDSIVYKTEIKDGYHNGDNYFVSAFTLTNDVVIRIIWDYYIAEDYYVPTLYIAQGELIGDHTISVYHEDSVIHKLDAKYLPDEVAGFELVRFSFGEDDALVCDKTYQELADKVSKKVLVGILDEGEGSVLTPAFAHSRDDGGITFKFSGYNHYLRVKVDGSADFFEAQTP